MKRLAIIVAALLACITSQAKVELPSIFSDNMVIQRDTKAAIWGTAKPGSKVVVSPSWSKQKYTATADNQTGKWMTRIQTPAAGGPYEIRISDGEAVVLHNVLSGDVWYCGGQSNMDMTVKGYPAQPSTGGEELIMHAKASRPIRMCTITKVSSATVCSSTTGSWKENTPENVANTSATAYFFANYLQGVVDVPVGLLICCWGGSSIETWISRDVISSQFAEEFDLSFLEEPDKLKKNENHKPCVLYNGMVDALAPFTFKGMIWYQGETNRSKPEQYIRLTKAYVEMMRGLFEVPGAPFYYVQIAPYEYGNVDSFGSGYFYEAQEKCMDAVSGCYMAPTCDVGEVNTIHPCRKDVVGKRLALLALQHSYGKKGFTADAPRFKKAEFVDGVAVVSIDTHDDLSINPMSKELGGFDLAGEDRVFHPATGRTCVKPYGRNQIVVSCPEVPAPVAVRYAFRNYQPGTFFNNFGIPLLPFRSDNWPR